MSKQILFSIIAILVVSQNCWAHGIAAKRIKLADKEKLLQEKKHQKIGSHYDQYINNKRDRKSTTFKEILGLDLELEETLLSMKHKHLKELHYLEDREGQEIYNTELDHTTRTAKLVRNSRVLIEMKRELKNKILDIKRKYSKKRHDLSHQKAHDISEAKTKHINKRAKVLQNHADFEHKIREERGNTTSSILKDFREDQHKTKIEAVKEGKETVKIDAPV